MIFHASFTVGFVRNKTMADSNEIYLRVQLSKISRVELSEEELNLVLQTLLYDGKLEIVDPKVLTLSSSFFLFFFFSFFSSFFEYSDNSFIISSRFDCVFFFYD